MASITIIIRFVVVNFNNHSFTELLCNSLMNQLGAFEDYSIECVVVDNSTDNEDSSLLAKFASQYSWIRILKPAENKGYFGGLNYGLENTYYSKEQDIIIIGNNDLQFKSDFCEKLVKQYKSYEDNVYAICPNVITPEGLNQNPHILKKISFLRRIQFDVYFSHYYVASTLVFLKSLYERKHLKSNDTHPASGEIHMGIGACYILTANFLKSFSKLSYPYFLYGEEAFFSEQIHSEKGILYFDSSLTVFHAESATLSKIPKRISYEYAKKGYPSYRKLL
jgi:GT2 family glycosyltransferase